VRSFICCGINLNNKWDGWALHQSIALQGGVQLHVLGATLALQALLQGISVGDVLLLRWHCPAQETDAKEANLTKREGTHHFMTPTGCAAVTPPCIRTIVLVCDVQ
jgi:hypothetical protein